jgi:isocitrate dehydrogenase (NAD+)
MLRQLQEVEAADRIHAAVLSVFAEGKHLTGDLGGKAKTSEFTEAVIEKL